MVLRDFHLNHRIYLACSTLKRLKTISFDVKKIRYKMEQLPPNYSYHFIADEKYLCFRIKEVLDKESTAAWVKEYSRETKTTWRIMRTYPSSGMFNIYKVDYRCCHNTDRRVKGTGPSKHTGCQARLDITINRFRENSKMCKVDLQLVKSHPCFVKLLQIHNHPVHTAEALKYRDLDPKVKDKIRNLFRQGYNPATALKLHKSDLMLEKGSEYCQAESDGMLMPTYSVVHKLFQREFSHNYGAVPDEVMNDDTVATDHSSSNLVSDTNKVDEKMEVISQLRNLWKKIEEKVELNPDVFLPAAKTMLGNVEKFTTTDTGLVRAMCTFGNFRCVKRIGRKKVVRKRQKKVTGEQFTDIASKKSLNLPYSKEIITGELSGQTINMYALY